MALINCLPPTSSSQVMNIYNNLSSRFGRACTFTELSRALNVYRHAIDRDIQQNGSSGDQTNRIRMHSINSIKNKSATAYTLNMSRGPPQRGVEVVRHSPRSSGIGNMKPRPGPYISKPTDRPRILYIQKNERHTNSKNQAGYQKSGYGPGLYKPRNQNTYMKQNSSKKKNSCTLCGKYSHDFTDCPNMINENGKRVQILPTYGYCGQCPAGLQLRHPPTMCPYREGLGPLHRGNVNQRL